MVESAKIISTKRVVVLIPPAVELGEPPINISIQVRRVEGVDKVAVSVRFIPAVLGEMASKKLTSIAWELDIWLWDAFFSKIKNKKAGTIIKTDVTDRTIFVCN